MTTLGFTVLAFGSTDARAVSSVPLRPADVIMQGMHVVIFEGSRWPTFAPLSLSRPVFTLMTGTGSLLEKQVRHLNPTRLTLWVRPELEEHCRVRLVPKMPCPTDVNAPLGDEPALLWSGRAVPLGRFEYPPHDAIMPGEDDRGPLVHAALTHSPGLSPDDMRDRTDRWLKLTDLPHMMPQGRLIPSLWELLHWNEESLVEDGTNVPQPAPPKAAGPYHMCNDEDVHVGQGATLAPGVVLDASKGPVVIAGHARVGANSVLVGPCYVGPHTVVRPLTLIRPGTSIGAMCNVGGEISNSVMLSNSNKAHDGYLGDSYLGKWVNLGAGTTTSNLKNTYGEVTLDVCGRRVPTGRVKLGALIGDHVKTAVLTRFSAGSYVGFCSMLAGAVPPPRFVPTYTFTTERGAEPYRLDKAIEVTRRIYTRRDRLFTETDERVMRYVVDAAAAVERC